MKNLVNYLNDYFDENEEEQLSERKFSNKPLKFKSKENRKMLNEDYIQPKIHNKHKKG